MWSRAGGRVWRQSASLIVGLGGLSLFAEHETRRKSCAKSNVSLFAWGSNQFGQLGITTLATDQFKPTNVNEELGFSVSDIAAFGEASALVNDEGDVYVFGRSTHGSLGQGSSFENCSIPTLLPQVNGVKSVSVGEFHMACVDSQGALWTSGRNWTGEVGREVDTTHLGRVESDLKFKKVSCGRTFTAAVDESGKLYTWGNGKQGVLGHGSVDNVSLPKLVEDLKHVKVADIACGQEILLVATEDGKVYSCGNNDYHKLGYESDTRVQPSLQQLKSLSREHIVQVCCGDYHCAALTSEGKMYTWGACGEGQLGHGTRRDLGTPTLVAAFKKGEVGSIACGGSHTLAVTKDGALFVWGKGRNGQLGAGDNLESVAAYHTTPKQVEFFKGRKVLKAAAGRDHTICLVQD